MDPPGFGKRHRRGPELGFTMVEVLITLSILAVALLPTMETYSGLWRAAGEVRRLRTAKMIGRDYLVRLRTRRGYRNLVRSAARAEGEFESSRSYHWERSVRPLEGSDPDFKALLVKLRVWFRPDPGSWRSIRCRRRRGCERWDFIGVVSKRGVPD